MGRARGRLRLPLWLALSARTASTGGEKHVNALMHYCVWRLWFLWCDPMPMCDRCNVRSQIPLLRSTQFLFLIAADRLAASFHHQPSLDFSSQMRR